MTCTEARIPPLAHADRDASQAALVAGQRSIPAPNMLNTLLRHDRLLDVWLPFARQLLVHGALPGRVRELTILRVGWRCGSEYEWSQHLPLAYACGLSADEIRDVALPLGSMQWSQADQTLLEAVDELVDNHDLCDQTWRRLTERLSDVELIELLMLVGHYVLVAGVANSLRIKVENASSRLGEP